MKKIIVLLFFCIFSLAQNGIPHCGYDFTSYIVVNAHENGLKITPDNLQITLVDLEGNEVINTDNSISLINNNQKLYFTKNYLIDEKRWYFPYATDQYFLVIRNTLDVENYQIKISDAKSIYQTVIIPISSINKYVLCSTEAERLNRNFGPKVTNQPVEVVLIKN